MLTGTAMPTPWKTTVTISVITYNRKEILGNLLDSLKTIEYRPLEIIIVDNNSGDGTGDMVRMRHPDVHYLRTPENLGATD